MKIVVFPNDNHMSQKIWSYYNYTIFLENQTSISDTQDDQHIKVEPEGENI